MSMLYRIAVILLLLPLAGLADSPVHLQILGIAQDAGYPQASCYQPHCLPAWQNPELRRLASSLAIIDTSTKKKYLFDATPDIREQLYQLNLSAPDREYALDGIFLTHAHIGHYTGIMHFGHEASGTRQTPVYVMPRMHDFLVENGPWDQLIRYDNIRLRRLQDGIAVRFGMNVTVTPLRVPHRDEYSETVGYRIDGPTKSAVFIPDIDKWSRWDSDIRDVIRSVDYALLDATFFADGEIPDRDMSQIPHPFVAESMDLFAELTPDEKARVIFIHFNHTNPLLIDGSDAQKIVTERGFRFAREGLRLGL